MGCDIGYGYLHRIPVSVDRSQPRESYALLPQIVEDSNRGEKPPSVIVQPGQTGIPQIDQFVNVSDYLKLKSLIKLL